jgi:hypothetical protein
MSPMKGFEVMKKKEAIVQTTSFLLFTFLLLWIYPANIKSVNKTNYIENKNVIGIQSKQVLSHYETKKELLKVETKIEYSHTEETKERIGSNMVFTGSYKRIRYLGRYVHLTRPTSVTGKEYEYLFTKELKMCDPVCKYVISYTYDVYEVKPIYKEEVVYLTKNHDVYNIVEYPVYKEVEYPVYENVEEILYAYECVKEGYENPVVALAENK